MQSLKPTGLPPESSRSCAMKAVNSRGVEKALWREGERQSLPCLDAADRCDLRGHLRAGQHAAVAGLGALAQLDLDHLDLRIGRGDGELVGVKAAVGAPATKVAGAELPDNVAAALLVIGAVAAFAGVMREAAKFGAAVERADRVGAERAKAHRGNIEDARGIRLTAVRAADADAKRGIAHVGRRQRMMQPLEARLAGVELGAERALVELHLGALIDHGALRAAEGEAVGFALEEILPHLRADVFEQESEVRGDRVGAQHRMFGLHQIADAEHAEEQAGAEG